MRKHLLPLALLLTATPALPQASANIAAGRAQTSPLAPAEIVNAAPKADWAAIAASDLLVMDLAPDAKGKPRRVVIQLMPVPFSQGWVGNIRKLAAARFWDGTSINRVQDNYVVQWGDANAEDKAKAKRLPDGLAVMTEADYAVPVTDSEWAALAQIAADGAAQAAMEASAIADGSSQSKAPTARYLATDPYARTTTFAEGWPWTYEISGRSSVHCYGMVGVGRDMPPNTGTGMLHTSAPPAGRMKKASRRLARASAYRAKLSLSVERYS